jgi:hypothetical protein
MLRCATNAQRESSKTVSYTTCAIAAQVESGLPDSKANLYATLHPRNPQPPSRLQSRLSTRPHHRPRPRPRIRPRPRPSPRPRIRPRSRPRLRQRVRHQLACPVPTVPTRATANSADTANSQASSMPVHVPSARQENSRSRAPRRPALTALPASTRRRCTVLVPLARLVSTMPGSHTTSATRAHRASSKISRATPAAIRVPAGNGLTVPTAVHLAVLFRHLSQPNTRLSTRPRTRQATQPLTPQLSRLHPRQISPPRSPRCTRPRIQLPLRLRRVPLATFFWLVNVIHAPWENTARSTTHPRALPAQTGKGLLFLPQQDATTANWASMLPCNRITLLHARIVDKAPSTFGWGTVCALHARPASTKTNSSIVRATSAQPVNGQLAV